MRERKRVNTHCVAHIKYVTCRLRRASTFSDTILRKRNFCCVELLLSSKLDTNTSTHTPAGISMSVSVCVLCARSDLTRLSNICATDINNTAVFLSFLFYPVRSFVPASARYLLVHIIGAARESRESKTTKDVSERASGHNLWIFIDAL